MFLRLKFAIFIIILGKLVWFTFERTLELGQQSPYSKTGSTFDVMGGTSPLKILTVLPQAFEIPVQKFLPKF